MTTVLRVVSLVMGIRVGMGPGGWEIGSGGIPGFSPPLLLDLISVSFSGDNNTIDTIDKRETKNESRNVVKKINQPHKFSIIYLKYNVPHM